jgi:hypothetical protein
MYYSNIREFTKADGAEIFYITTILEELSKVVFVHLFLLSLRGISRGFGNSHTKIGEKENVI